MIPQYRFFLQVGTGGTQVAAHPVYGGSLALNYELQQGERFFRAKLNGKLTFLREDYTMIMAQPFGTVFYLYMEKSTDAAGMVFVPYYKSKFTITDCTVNLDNKIITVQPQTTDQYDEVLAGLENEYNLITLTPAMNSVAATKRPLVQIYEAGADIINCYIAGTSWEQDCTANANKNELGHWYWFGIDTIFIRATIESGAYAGTYANRIVRTGTHTDGATNYEDFDGNLENEAGATDYYIKLDTYVQAGYYEDYWFGRLSLMHRVGGTETEVGYKILASTTFNSGEYELGSVDVYFDNTFIMGRWLTDAESVDGVTLYDLPEDDIAGENKNYHKAAQISAGCCYFSTETSATPTEWGVANDAGTLYYAPPSSLFGEWVMPIAQSSWMNQKSYWFDYDTLFVYLEEKGKAAYTMKNVYPLWSCISVLLGQFSSVTFDGTTDYSQFLYASTNPVSGTAIKLFVTPKSNILAGDYSVPAQKAMTTLGSFLDMLRNVYQCYWYIDADNRLRIEHISWFKNGGSYSSSPTIGIDLTTLLEKRNDTDWSYGVNEYTYEKEAMPQRYQFEWMDDARIPFNGEAIEVLSPSVTEGRVENISVGGFSSDLDYMLLNPSVFSQDGFALIGATGSGNDWVVPYITYTTQAGITTTLQNGYLAYVHLQPYYWVYDMPAKSVKINGITYALSYVARHKTQKVSVPLGGEDVDFLKLIKTGMGNGEIKAVSIPLTSRVAQITLNYDTE